MTSQRLSDLDLAALLCSRVCHDVISPVGSIANGLELMEDPDADAEMRRIAFEMVKNSANKATAKLKFCRIAFGAAGSAGSLIDMGEAGEVTKLFVGDEKMKLEWLVPRDYRPKQEVKLLLNMVLLAQTGIPRGGIVTVLAEGRGFTVTAKGDRARVNPDLAQALDGTIDLDTMDARYVQPYYARILAESARYSLAMKLDSEDCVVVTAAPLATAEAA